MSDNFEKYKGIINGIYRQAKVDLWTTEFATLLLLLFGVLFVSIIMNVVFFSFGNWFISFLVFFVEIAAPLIVLYLHQRKIYEAVRAKTLAMDSTHPGIYEAYEQWRSKADSPNN